MLSPDEILEKVIEYNDMMDEQVVQYDDLKRALIGWTCDWDTDGHRRIKLIYSSSRIIDVLMEDGMSEEDAREWFDYNVDQAYIGPNTPIIMYDY
jgi:hypothetical protein